MNFPLVVHGFACMKLLKPEIGSGRNIATASLSGFGFLNDSDVTIEMSAAISTGVNGWVSIENEQDIRSRGRQSAFKTDSNS